MICKQQHSSSIITIFLFPQRYGEMIPLKAHPHNGFNVSILKINNNKVYVEGKQSFLAEYTSSVLIGSLEFQKEIIYQCNQCIVIKKNYRTDVMYRYQRVTFQNLITTLIQDISFWCTSHMAFSKYKRKKLEIKFIYFSNICAL